MTVQTQSLNVKIETQTHAHILLGNELVERRQDVLSIPIEQ